MLIGLTERINKICQLIRSSRYAIHDLSRLQSKKKNEFYRLKMAFELEANLEPLCRERGLGVISYFSLASGFLTGKYRSEDDLSKSPRGGRVKQYG